MIAIRIEDATGWALAPDGWDERVHGKYSDYGDLVVRASRLGDVEVFESAWEPTPDELEALKGGGVVVLRMVGTQIPVSLSVKPPDVP